MATGLAGPIVITTRGWIPEGEAAPSDAIQTFSMKDFPSNSLLAHVMAKAGIFTSTNEARKNGWNKPITPGEYKFKKKQKTVVITA